MAGSRPLTKSEERLLVRQIRRLNARDRALITAQLFLGFRISEILALTVGHVLAEGRIRPRVALPPRLLKGKRGTTRTIPVGPGLHRVLERYLEKRGRREELRPEEPLFLSPRKGPDGAPQPICRSMAEKIIRKAMQGLGTDPQGLSTHSLRKTWAGRLYKASNHDILLVRDGLGHRSVAVTETYLPTSSTRMEEMIRRSDWTRARKARATKTVDSGTRVEPQAEANNSPKMLEIV